MNAYRNARWKKGDFFLCCRSWRIYGRKGEGRVFGKEQKKHKPYTTFERNGGKTKLESIYRGAFSPLLPPARERL